MLRRGNSGGGGGALYGVWLSIMVFLISLAPNLTYLPFFSSGFFYSIFRGRAGVGVDVLSLPGGPEAGGFAPLLDFMYTSRLRLSPTTAPAVLAAATYLQMEHVVQACHRFIQAR